MEGRELLNEFVDDSDITRVVYHVYELEKRYTTETVPVTKTECGGR